jgi:hypothetical protein
MEKGLDTSSENAIAAPVNVFTFYMEYYLRTPFV